MHPFRLHAAHLDPNNTLQGMHSAESGRNTYPLTQLVHLLVVHVAQFGANREQLKTHLLLLNSYPAAHKLQRTLSQSTHFASYTEQSYVQIVPFNLYPLRQDKQVELLHEVHPAPYFEQFEQIPLLSI